MNNNSSYKTVSHAYDVAVPKRSRAYPISVEEWKSLKKRIASIPNDSNYMQIFGSIFVGAFLSGLFTALGTDVCQIGTQDCGKEYFVYSYTAVSGVLGAILLYLGREKDQRRVSSVDDVHAYMDEIAEKFIDDGG